MLIAIQACQQLLSGAYQGYMHDDVIKWKRFPRYWPFVRGIHRSPVNSPHKGQWRGALMFSLICVWMNSCANNREAGDLRRYRVHYDVSVMGCFLHTLILHNLLQHHYARCEEILMRYRILWYSRIALITHGTKQQALINTNKSIT